MRVFIVCTILVFCFSASTFGQKSEILFYGEETFKNLVQMPEQVLKILSQDKRVQECTAKSSSTKVSANLFEATTINLNSDILPDLLVKAKDDNNCINGNAISFWLFRNKSNDYELVLYLYTIIVVIEEAKQKEFYKISASRSTANTTYITDYVFNGLKYEPQGKREIPISQK